MSQNEFAILKQIAMMDNETLRLMMQLSGDIDSTSDLYNWILWQISRRADMMSSIRSQLQYNAPEIKSMAEHITHMESFCRNTKASDECIKSVQSQIDEAKSIISSYDTADTSLITTPSASSAENDSNALMMKQLLLFKAKLTA